jgi:hypothetical protein
MSFPRGDAQPNHGGTEAGVIASEATQSHGDCFVAAFLAMTILFSVTSVSPW